MKKTASFILALMMLFLCLGGAMAGAGDRVIRLTDDDTLPSNQYLEYAAVAGEKLWVYYGGSTWMLGEVNLTTGETTVWDLKELQDSLTDIDPEGAEGGDGETEDPDEDEEESNREALSSNGSVSCMFIWQGEPYLAISLNTSYMGEASTVSGGHVRKLELHDGKATLAEEDAVTLDWSAMVESSGTAAYSRYANASVAAGDQLFLSVYDDNGNSEIMAFDLTTGAYTEHTIQDLSDIGVTPDGRLMVCQYVWGERSEKAFSLYDPEDESMEVLVRFDLSEGSVNNFAWNPDTDTIYYTRNGEIYRAANRDLSQAEPVNDSPIANSEFALLTEGEQLVIWNYNGAYLRNTDPEKRSAVTLRIRPFSWSTALEDASNAFVAEHSDISIVREEFGDSDTLLAGMMNQDSSVDIFLVETTNSAFSAVYRRGFMADLSGSGTLPGEVAKMYPWARMILEREGKLVGIPVTISGTTLGYSTEAMKKLGMSREEMPGSWEEFLDFLQELPGKTAGTEVRPFELYTYRNSLKEMMVSQILTQYSMANEDQPFNTERLRNLLDRIQKMDCEALEILDAEELDGIQDAATYKALGGEREGLFMTYGGLNIESYNWNTPLILALEAGGEALAPVSMTVAFVNPYSIHQTEAAAFLEKLLERLDTSTRYSLYPDLMEPIRYPGHEETRKSIQKWLDQAQKNLEKVREEEDEEEIENWEEVLKTYEEVLEDYDSTSWLVSPEGIELYRQMAGYLKVQTWDFYSALNSGGDGELFQQMMQSFCEGSASSGELLSYIDRKVQMMRLEGN